MLASLCGCRHVMDTELYLPKDFRSDISLSMLNSSKVSRGDLENSMQFPLVPEQTNMHAYKLDPNKLEQDQIKYQAVFDRVRVEPGAYVKKGDLLIEFSSEDLNNRAKELKASVKEYEEEADYLKKMASADNSTDYSKQIRLAEKEIEYNKELLKEVEADIRSISIFAEEDGIVDFMDESVKKGIPAANIPLIRTRQVCEDYYISDESGKLKDLFKPGETYKVRASKREEELHVKCSNIEEVSKENTEGAYRINFKTIEPVEGDYGILYLVREGIRSDNVLFVNKEFVNKDESGDFVYVAGDDGLLEKKDVKLGEQVDDKYIILDGLKEKDTVYMPGNYTENTEEVIKGYDPEYVE